MMQLVVIGLTVGLIFEISGMLVMRSLVRANKQEFHLFHFIVTAAPSFDFIFGLFLMLLGIIFPIFFIKNNL
jgi:hypothetical protein